MPVCRGVMLVSVFFPGGNLPGQGGLIGNAAIETLEGEDGELGFGHVEPASMLWSVMPFEALDEATRLWGGEGGVERCGRVRAQIVLDQYDFGRVGKMGVGEVFQDLGVIDGGVMVGDFDMPPTLERRERHEQIGDAMAFVFVVLARWLSRLGGDRLARFDDQLLRRFESPN